MIADAVLMHEDFLILYPRSNSDRGTKTKPTLCLLGSMCFGDCQVHTREAMSAGSK